MPAEKFSISMTPQVLSQVSIRGKERSSTINRDLDRYYYLLARGRLSSRSEFSMEELGFICDSLHNVTLGPGAQGVIHLPDSVEHVIRFGLEQGPYWDIEFEDLTAKWGIDGKALTDKLFGLDPLRVFALQDAVEAYWQRIDRGEEVKLEDVLRLGGTQANEEASDGTKTTHAGSLSASKSL